MRPALLRSQNSQIDTSAKCKRVLDDANVTYDAGTPPMKLRILASGVLIAAAGGNILASEVVPDIEVRARADPNASLACAPRPPRFVRADSTKSPPFFRVALQAQTRTSAACAPSNMRVDG